MFAEKCDQGSIRAPYDILDRRSSNLRKLLLLLDVVEHDSGRRAKD